MMRYPWISLKALGVAAVVALAPHPALAGSDEIEAYGVRLPIQPAPGASVQRIALPAVALRAVQRADLGDVRVFDRSGRALPIALAGAGPSQAGRLRTRLKTYPILGRPGALKLTGLSLTFDEDRAARVVGVDGRIETSAADDVVTLGTLLDSRAVKQPAMGLLLDADLPISQPVSFRVEASTDLTDWRPLAQKVFFRAAPADQSVTSELIGLNGADLRGQYLRVTWSAASRLLAPVRIRGATVTTAAASGGADRVIVEASTPPLGDPFQLRFALPFGAPVAALRIVPPAGTALIPVTMFGRADREQPWTRLGDATVYRMISNGTERTNGAIELPDGIFREVRIDADRRSGGFPAAPHVELHFAPRQIIALLSGPAPFTLAAGSATAGNAYLPVGKLIPDGRIDQLPSAIVRTDPGSVLELASSAGTGTPRRTIILWLALLLATLTLGAIVWLLVRSMKRSAPSASDPGP